MERRSLENSLFLYKSPDKCAFKELLELDLSNCELIDITCSLKNLKLKNLNLSSNKLTKVPKCFYLGLEHLEFLDISHNMISNFEVEPNCCRTLKVLNIKMNRLKDIPQWIMSHRAIRLKELYYDFNKITQLRCIFGLNMLFSVPKLSLRNCILRDEDCGFLKNCKYLEELDISNTDEYNIHSNLIAKIDNFLYQPNLQNLCILKMNKLTLSVFPEGLTWFEGLTELHLMNNDLMYLPMDGLEFFVNLELFNLAHNLITCIPEKLTWLTDLKILDLSYNRLEILCDISRMENLEILDLYSNRLDHFDHEFINMNLNGLDIEMNFLDSNLWNPHSYQKMKNVLRMRIPEQKRIDGVIEVPQQLTDESCSSSEGIIFFYH